MVKVTIQIGFTFNIALHDWLKKLAPLFYPIRSTTKPIVTRSHTFSGRFSCQFHLIIFSFGWFAVLSLSFVIG